MLLLLDDKKEYLRDMGTYQQTTLRYLSGVIIIFQLPKFLLKSLLFLQRLGFFGNDQSRRVAVSCGSYRGVHLTINNNDWNCAVGGYDTRL